MIPILMQDETTVGFLKEAMSCVVTEERNGVFELALTYPVTGALFDKLQIDRFVKAKPNDTADLQLFRIYEVTKPMNGVVTVNAEHVSYALSNFPVEEINITGTATQAINEVLSDVTYNLDYFDKLNPFRVATTDMDAVKAFSFKIGSARAALGGTEGSVLDVYGGEYEFDNYTIRLHKNRGRDTGIVIAYGKNMTDIKVTTSLESAYTALYPYAIKDNVLYVANVWEYDTEPTLTFIEYDPIMPVQNRSGIADRILIRDFTNDFEKDETVTNRTLAESGSALDAIRGSKIYTYNLISNQIVPEVTQINVPEPDPEEGVVVAQSEEETLNGASAPEVSEHTSTGFVIGRETPDAVLSEDGANIDLYAMAALNWRATQELLERIEQLEARL